MSTFCPREDPWAESGKQGLILKRTRRRSAQSRMLCWAPPCPPPPQSLQAPGWWHAPPEHSTHTERERLHSRRRRDPHHETCACVWRVCVCGRGESVRVDMTYPLHEGLAPLLGARKGAKHPCVGGALRHAGAALHLGARGPRHVRERGE